MPRSAPGDGRCCTAPGIASARSRTVDLSAGEPIPGAPFDLVYARLLLFHVSDRVAVLRRLWDAVAPGGHLVVHDYDVRARACCPRSTAIDEWLRVVLGAFTRAGCDVRSGRAAAAAVRAGRASGPRTAPTSPAGSSRSRRAARCSRAVYRSVLPTALEHGITSERDAEAALAALARDATLLADRPLLWPLLIGAFKRKSPGRR